jgi:hypothetical protein
MTKLKVSMGKMLTKSNKVALKHQKSNQINQQHIGNFNKIPIFQFSLKYIEVMKL